MQRQPLFLLLLLLLIIQSCSKEGKFLGETNFRTEIILRAYTSAPGAYVKIEIGDTVIKKLVLNESITLDQVLDYTIPLPPSAQTKVKIWWKNTSVLLVDTVINLNSKNTLYLIQLDPTVPHKFYASFGNENESQPDTLRVKARFIYIKDTGAVLHYPDTVRLKFTTLYQDKQTNDYLILNPDDTVSVELINGIVGSYLSLPDSRYPVNGPNNTLYDVFLGYQIINPKTGSILKDYCYEPLEAGIVDYSSDQGGKFQTVRLGYNEAGQICPAGNAPTYEPQILFGSNTTQ